MGGLPMPMLRRLASLVRNLFHSRQVEGDLDDELGAYLDLLTEEKVRSGLSPELARRAARIEAGGLEQTKERVRDARVGTTLEGIWRDIRYSMAVLGRNPCFSIVAVVTISLGIGANTAIFSAVNGVLLSPLPFEDPDRLVEVRETLLEKGEDEMAVAPADYQYWIEHGHSFSAIAAHYTHISFNLIGSGEPEKLSSAAVSASFFKVLGIEPELGRGFLSEETTPRRNTAVL